MAHYIVDASNVIGSRPDGWWRDRRAADERLIDAVVRYARGASDEYTVVLDRTGTDGVRDGVTVRHARRRGRDAADDIIVEVVANAPDANALVVVTADRDLRRRVDDLGARVTGPREFRDRLDF